MPNINPINTNRTISGGEVGVSTDDLMSKQNAVLAQSTLENLPKIASNYEKLTTTIAILHEEGLDAKECDKALHSAILPQASQSSLPYFNSPHNFFNELMAEISDDTSLDHSSFSKKLVSALIKCEVGKLYKDIDFIDKAYELFEQILEVKDLEIPPAVKSLITPLAFYCIVLTELYNSKSENETYYEVFKSTLSILHEINLSAKDCEYRLNIILPQVYEFLDMGSNTSAPDYFISFTEEIIKNISPDYRLIQDLSFSKDFVKAFINYELGKLYKDIEFIKSADNLFVNILEKYPSKILAFPIILLNFYCIALIKCNNQSKAESYYEIFKIILNILSKDILSANEAVRALPVILLQVYEFLNMYSNTAGPHYFISLIKEIINNIAPDDELITDPKLIKYFISALISYKVGKLYGDVEFLERANELFEKVLKKPVPPVPSVLTATEIGVKQFNNACITQIILLDRLKNVPEYNNLTVTIGLIKEHPLSANECYQVLQNAILPIGAESSASIYFTRFIHEMTKISPTHRPTLISKELAGALISYEVGEIYKDAELLKTAIELLENILEEPVPDTVKLVVEEFIKKGIFLWRKLSNINGFNASYTEYAKEMSKLNNTYKKHIFKQDENAPPADYKKEQHDLKDKYKDCIEAKRQLNKYDDLYTKDLGQLYTKYERFIEKQNENIKHGSGAKPDSFINLWYASQKSILTREYKNYTNQLEKRTSSYPDYIKEQDELNAKYATHIKEQQDKSGIKEKSNLGLKQHSLKYAEKVIEQDSKQNNCLSTFYYDIEKRLIAHYEFYMEATLHMYPITKDAYLNDCKILNSKLQEIVNKNKKSDKSIDGPIIITYKKILALIEERNKKINDLITQVQDNK